MWKLVKSPSSKQIWTYYNRYLTGDYRLSTTLDQNLSRIQMRVTEQRNKHATRTKSGGSTTLERSLYVNALCHLGWDIHYFRRKSSCTNTSCQLGWGVHNFGHKTPYTNISSQLGWGVHNFGHESPYTNISGQLGWGVHNFGHQSQYTNISGQLGWGVRKFGRKSPYKTYQVR